MLDEMSYRTDLLGRVLAEMRRATAEACGATYEPRENRVFKKRWAGAHIRLSHLGACRAWGVEAKIGPSEDSFCQVRRLIATALGQEADEKWTAAVNLQPMLPSPTGS